MSPCCSFCVMAVVNKGKSPATTIIRISEASMVSTRVTPRPGGALSPRPRLGTGPDRPLGQDLARRLTLHLTRGFPCIVLRKPLLLERSPRISAQFPHRRPARHGYSDRKVRALIVRNVNCVVRGN